MEGSPRAEGQEVLKRLTDRIALEHARLLVIIAHPDDEVIGAGARLRNLKSSTFVHVTNGATVGDGAQARRRSAELATAMSLAGLSNTQLQPIGRADQSLPHTLIDLTHELRLLIAEENPDALLTHPYEGGHPDHDAIALAVHAACRAITQAPPVIEMAFYHQGAHGICTGEFLPDSETPTITLELSPPERAFKKSLLHCFSSQAQMLSYFSVDTEKFRIAPLYDFTQPPHPGRLFYENFDWGVRSGAEWRALARDALVELGLQQ